MAILVINGGSSSLKACLFKDEKKEPVWQAHVDWEGDFEAQLEKTLQSLPSLPLSAIGHRVVHGGEKYTKITSVDEAVKEEIRRLSFLVPLHNPINLSGIKTCERLFPHIQQFAAFDTSFHMTLSEAAYTYPLASSYKTMGIRRFGFHGISYAYCSQKTAEFLNQPLHKFKMVICHLGAGASLCAIKEGKSIDTTMGMTPLEGLMMATRSGTIDPGVLLYLLKEQKKTVDILEEELNEKSGLLGISGISKDMRQLEKAAEQGNPHAILALDVFLHRLKSCLGAMVAVLEGLDILVFTAGIGENSSFVREKVCAAFSFLGIEMDSEKNKTPSLSEREISSLTSRVKVLVIPTREEWEIAKQCHQELQEIHVS